MSGIPVQIAWRQAEVKLPEAKHVDMGVNLGMVLLENAYGLAARCRHKSLVARREGVRGSPQSLRGCLQLGLSVRWTWGHRGAFLGEYSKDGGNADHHAPGTVNAGLIYGLSS
jgi:hypothetical protein